MFKLATLIALLLLSSSLVLALPATLSKRQSACGAVHILVARGSTEAQGEGALSQMVTKIKTRLSGTTVTSEAIRYPALLEPYDYSSAQGTAAVKSQLTAAASRCPTSKIVLMGYSQGAHIIGDALGGGGGPPLLGPKTPAMDASIVRGHVKAVILMGDPRQNPADPFNKGTAKTGGRFPRDKEQLATLRSFKDLIAGYCDRGDTFCASGTSLITHLQYIEKYGDDATAFVAGMV
ncbi:hypothetical protein HK104_004047 [Borealophlyctis nickersoniae]|nr:hypothetical protein HK104_004047 [Borealophlyctis nickersoniae]